MLPPPQGISAAFRGRAARVRVGVSDRRAQPDSADSIDYEKLVGTVSGRLARAFPGHGIFNAAAVGFVTLGRREKMTCLVAFFVATWTIRVVSPRFWKT
jgi:hypothetical protein